MIGSLEARKAGIFAAYEAQAARERAELRAQEAYRARERRTRSRYSQRDSQRYRSDNSYALVTREDTRLLAPTLIPPDRASVVSLSDLTQRYAQFAPRLDLSPRYAPRVELAPMPIEALTSSRGWTLPARGRLSSRFGMRYHPVSRRRKLHTGHDIAAQYGSPIRAAKAGRVLWAGWKKAYGNTVIVDVGGGMTTLYAHASRVVCAPGSRESGTNHWRRGHDGFSTGPHLHFEVRKNGRPLDPSHVLRGHRH
jgi:murein DD-endopeptidase MepM/ murein hydrolase activator NlpD